MLSVSDVTIIIPIYVKTEQHLHYAHECVASAVGQGCRVLMLDDGSPMDPRPVLAEFANDTTLLMREDNKGVGHTRNQLASNVTTKLLLPLDSDDVLVPGAVEAMVNVWTGKPVYPDIELFGVQSIPHYKLKDFSCKNLETAVGLAPVSVLHSREQWASISGWNEEVELYEDGEYNARLFSQYCAVRLSKPLLRYRQHEEQRSKHPRGREIARNVHQKYILAEVMTMARGCCGGSKRSSPTVQPQTQAPSSNGGRPIMFNSTAQPTALPGSESDRIRARYVGGKGKGPHYYKGTGTGFRYKVVHGGEYSVDPTDAAFNDAQVGLGPNRSQFVALEEVPQDSTFQASEEAPAQDSVERQARVEVERTPVEEAISIPEEVEMPDLSNMTVNDVEELYNLTPVAAKMLMEQEARGKNRVGVHKHLKKFLNG